MYGNKMAVKNKKAILTILESVIGVLIVLLALVYFVSQQTKTIGKEEKAKEIAAVILDEIEKNQTLRDYITGDGQAQALNASISNLILQLTPLYDFSFCISEADKTCDRNQFFNPLPEKKDIFADSLLISYIDDTIKTKKLTIYIWPR